MDPSDIPDDLPDSDFTDYDPPDTTSVDGVTILHADDLNAHTYLQDNLPDWSSSMQAILNRGGPWDCGPCGGPSYLSYRCSKCGADLTED